MQDWCYLYFKNFSELFNWILWSRNIEEILNSQSRIFAILVDEITDSSHQEQLCCCVQYPDSSRKGINYLFDLVRIYHQSYLEWKVLNDDRCNCKTGAHVFSPFKFSEKFMFFVWFAAANKLMSITIILNASFRDHWLWGMYWIDWFYTRINWISEKLNTRRVGQQWF